jgi:hypothetical protein
MRREGKNQGGQGNSHVSEGQREKENPKRHSTASPERRQYWQITPEERGWGAQRRAKEVGREGGHCLSRAEVEIRLVWVERGEKGRAGLLV